MPWEGVLSPSLKVFKRHPRCGTEGQCVGLGSPGLMVGHNDLKGLFQPY